MTVRSKPPLTMKLYITAGLACILGTSACKREDSVFERFMNASRLADSISSEFTRDFPNTLKPFKMPPSLGRVGELTEIQNPKFVLLNFPTSDISKVRAWMAPIINRYGVQSISISYFQDVPAANPDDIGFNGMNRVTVFKNGRTETQTGLQVEQAWDKATIDEHQILQSEGGCGQPAPAPSRSDPVDYNP
jgi:hypothetical protein